MAPLCLISPPLLKHLGTPLAVLLISNRAPLPEQLQSDQGRQFESILIAEICKILHIRKTMTTPYHPQGDGLVARFNRTLVKMLATSISDLENDSWEEHFPKMCLAYNTCTHPTTGETPFLLIYDRQAHLPVDLMYGTKSTGTSVSGYEKELGLKLFNRLEKEQEVCNNCRENCMTSTFMAYHLRLMI